MGIEGSVPWLMSVAARLCGGLGEVLDQSMWNLWLMKWHGDKLLTGYFDFPLSGPFKKYSILIIIYR
jgi:hypothetical protein